jgi:nitrile hydratase accessory protein
LRPSELEGLPRDGDGPVFAEPWEAQAFALAVKLHEVGVFTWTEWADALGAEIRAAPQRAYYESWLAALEVLAEAKGVTSAAERRDRIGDWARAAKATPHGKPIELSRSSLATETARSASRKNLAWNQSET